jgi:hypothetical protein
MVHLLIVQNLEHTIPDDISKALFFTHYLKNKISGGSAMDTSNIVCLLN